MKPLAQRLDKRLVEVSIHIGVQSNPFSNISERWTDFTFFGTRAALYMHRGLSFTMGDGYNSPRLDNGHFDKTRWSIVLGAVQGPAHSTLVEAELNGLVRHS
jgi:hypothetical protein